jgi:hypothetical protein
LNILLYDAVSGKYGQVNIPKVGLGETILILRAQNKLAVAALEIYRVIVQSHGTPLAAKIKKKSIALKDGKASKRYLINSRSFEHIRQEPFYCPLYKLEIDEGVPIYFL